LTKKKLFRGQVSSVQKILSPKAALLDIELAGVDIGRMSLPPGFLDELRTRSSLARVVGRKVSWDQRKSNQAKGDMWASCPFHQEKTASFHVDDRQGFYYCFGCHAKGDAISFVRETENVGFMEAVEILAREAGMQVPARDPEAQQKADHRSQLTEIMEAAVQFYRLQLKTAKGAVAREYLQSRGLSDSACARWDIGFAPDSRQALWTHLRDKAIAPERIIDAGLAAKPDDGGAPYDRFRDRIIFPIRDGRGRCTALGGRAMAADARAKYLNSPETALFDKGRSLYNQAPAREAAGKGQPLVVVEGYMDVIAMSQAGFGAVVAPLGTAITQEQLALIWRIDAEPIIALDGDTAGLRAAQRLVDLALPMVEAGQSLRFATMPQGQDPDDLLRTGGAAALQQVLDQAQPMVRLLWQRETEGKVFDSPERKAALDKTLRDCIRRIKDTSIRAHYGEEIRRLRWELFNSGRQTAPFSRTSPGRRAARKLPPSTATRNSYLATATGADPEEFLRITAILAVLINNPAIIRHFETELEDLHLSTPDHRDICAALLRHATADHDRIRAQIDQDIGADALEKLFGLSHVQIIPVVRAAGDEDSATMCVAQELAKLAARRGAELEILDAGRDLTGDADEGITWRLGQAAQARAKAERSQTDDRTEYHISDSGARIKRDERREFEHLLDAIDFAKRTKPPH
jgi:DNA primase